MERYVKLTYFKKSGKYYCEGSFFSENEFDFEIYDQVRMMNIHEQLPDLDSGAWGGFILVDPENGVKAIVYE
jgi:hypothetical protein